ncbi:MAG: thiol:disulfide interchange protein DsbA/DsbL [Methylococcales bacterium]|jgi:protein dithiol oxidoreductase (disulfide-forming)|nr:thiol:disulfide interchange protein DsbA/DsbL [Methylococcales bacterium]MBT7445739.1 thiol:disulfide interchange protein DsbA/DsbL [Methylococcales bacterium]
MKKLLLIWLCFLPLVSHAEIEYYEDIHFTEITPVTPVTNTGKIEVIEVFWYACSHCFSFEKYIQAWLKTKADDVEYTRVPGVLSKRWILLAKVYYAARDLGVEEKLTPMLFNHIHLLNNKVNSVAAAEKVFVANGVAAKDFRKAIKSFSVNTKIGQAKSLNKKYGIKGVPALIIDGRYRIDSGSIGSFEKVIDIANFLIKKARTERTTQ